LPVVPPKDKEFIDNLIKRNRDKDAFQPGLKFGDEQQEGKQFSSSNSQFSNGDRKQAEIDKKLEDLGKRMKN